MSHERFQKDLKRACERIQLVKFPTLFLFCRKLNFEMLPKDEVCTKGIYNFK